MNEMKETMNSLKTLASDTSSREILNFLKEDSQRQAARDDAFLQLMGALVKQSNPNVVSPMTYSMQDTRSQLPTQSNPAVISPVTYPMQDTRSQLPTQSNPAVVSPMTYPT